MPNDIIDYIKRLERRIAHLEGLEGSGGGASDHGDLTGLGDDDHTGYLLATGARTGASSAPQVFTYPVIAPVVDYPNTHATDSDHFNQNTSGYPSGWTQVDAPDTTNTTNLLGFWFLNNTSLSTSWKYRRQLQPITESSFMSVNFGPLCFRDGNFTADLYYYFGMYADNGSGTIDETKYNRIELLWDSAGGVWKVRSVISDGSTTVASTYKTLPFPLPQGFSVRVQTYVATNQRRGYIGMLPIPATQTLLQATTAATIVWNQPWLQIESSRGAGVEDFLYIGGYNRSNLP